MRSPIVLIVAFFTIVTSDSSFAQTLSTGPKTLSMQISEQQTAVKTASGDKAWEAWLKLAVLLQDAARYRESEDAYGRTVNLLKANDPPVLANVMDHMGTMYADAGQLSKAETMERQALAIREESHDQRGTGVSHIHLTTLLLVKHAWSSAETEAESAATILVPEYSSPSLSSTATPEEKMTALINLSLVCSALENYSAAVPSLRRALTIAHASYSDNSIPVGYIDFLLGYALWKVGYTDDADELMRHGVQTLAAQIGWGHPSYLKVLRQYETYLKKTGRKAEARQISSELKKLNHKADAASTPAGTVEVSQNSLH